MAFLTLLYNAPSLFISPLCFCRRVPRRRLCGGFRFGKLTGWRLVSGKKSVGKKNRRARKIFFVKGSSWRDLDGCQKYP